MFLSNCGMATPSELSQICFYSFWNTRRSVDKLMANTGGISCNALAVKAGAWLWTTWCECKQTCPQLSFWAVKCIHTSTLQFLTISSAQCCSCIVKIPLKQIWKLTSIWDIFRSISTRNQLFHEWTMPKEKTLVWFI